MSTKTNLPTIKTPGNPLTEVTSVKEVIEAVPSIVTSFAGIIDSCNNRDVRMCEINQKANVENNKNEKDYLDKCNKWEFKKMVMKDAFASDKVSGEQIVELAKEFVK